MKKLWLFFVKFFGHIIGIFPRKWIRASGAWLGFLWFDVFGFRKDIILKNMEIAFPDWPQEKKIAVGRKSVYQLGYNFMEFLTIPSMSTSWVKQNVIFEGWENVEKARAGGKGFFFLSLHLGNGDSSANAIALRGQEIYIISKRFKTKWFDNLWFSIRGAQGVKYIDAHGPNNAFEILKALKKNAGIVFVLDQFMGRPYGIASTFFGRRTGTAYGLALFVQKTKAPVLPTYTFEGEDGKIHVVFEPALDTASCVIDDNKDQTISNLTQMFNDKLEQIVRKHPEQWMWVHRRWKDFE
ncbi:Lipid A biosynthesis lauroyl acyltransferase [compost metagenome]